jgi:hypothetical protein
MRFPFGLEVKRTIVSQRLAVFGAGIALLSSSMTIGFAATSTPAGADTETHSSTSWVYSGWVMYYFYTCDDAQGYELACPKWAWITDVGGESWQSWNLSGGGVYDKMTQDFWRGLIGTETGSGEPNHLDQLSLSVSSVTSDHYDGSYYVSSAYPNGICFYETMPIQEPCAESNQNTNGHHYADPIDNGYVVYDDNHGDNPAFPDGYFLRVLNGYIS